MNKSKVKGLSISCIVLFILLMLAYLLDVWGDYFYYVGMWSLDVRELLSLAALGIIFFAMLFCMGSMVRTMYPGAEKKLLRPEQKKNFCSGKRLTICICGTVFNLILARSVGLILNLFLDFENGARYVTNVDSGWTVKDLINWGVIIYLLAILFAVFTVIMAIYIMIKKFKQPKE